MNKQRIPVLIVGGGPVGLSAAVALARQGVRSVLVERRPATTDHPKARAINVRTMEMLRQWGIEQDLIRYALPQEYWRFIWCTTMTGREIGRVSNLEGELSDKSPSFRRIVSQDAVETVLARYARSLPLATLRFSTRCLFFRQLDTGVLAEVEDVESGRRETLEARYLIAADGATSGIRRRLGIEMEGSAEIAQQASIYFRADLTPYSTHRPADIYYCIDGIWIAVVDGKTRWLGIMGHDPKAGGRREEFTPEFCIEKVRRSVGVEDLPVEVISTSFWKMGAEVAARFRDRHVFLAGDAAHRMSPTGGFGLNTGVQDSHNLAWKLAAVLDGAATDALLDTYETERKPVAASNANWSADNARRIWAIIASLQAGEEDRGRDGIAEQKEHICSEGRALGFRYESPAVVSDGMPPPAFSSRLYRPAAFPGCRAPHVWLGRNGRRWSTLDLFERRFVLLTAAPGSAWREAAEGVDGSMRQYLEVVAIGPEGDFEDPGGDWKTSYALAAEGAVLVRPDGHVAWRTAHGADRSGARLGGVLRAVMGGGGEKAPRGMVIGSARPTSRA